MWSHAKPTMQPKLIILYLTGIALSATYTGFNISTSPSARGYLKRAWASKISHLLASGLEENLKDLSS